MSKSNATVVVKGHMFKTDPLSNNTNGIEKPIKARGDI